MKAKQISWNKGVALGILFTSFFSGFISWAQNNQHPVDPSAHATSYGICKARGGNNSRTLEIWKIDPSQGGNFRMRVSTIPLGGGQPSHQFVFDQLHCQKNRTEMALMLTCEGVGFEGKSGRLQIELGGAFKVFWTPVPTAGLAPKSATMLSSTGYECGLQKVLEQMQDPTGSLSTSGGAIPPVLEKAPTTPAAPAVVAPSPVSEPEVKEAPAKMEESRVAPNAKESHGKNEKKSGVDYIIHPVSDNVDQFPKAKPKVPASFGKMVHDVVEHFNNSSESVSGDQ